VARRCGVVERGVEIVGGGGGGHVSTTRVNLQEDG
jgi:hypothetical protein